MRYALILVLLCAGCAGAGRSTAPPAERADIARADSLLALPPDSLSTADVQWLLRHARNEPGGAEVNRGTIPGAVTVTLAVLAVGGIIAGYVLLLDSTR